MKFPQIDFEFIKRIYEKTLKLAKKEMASLYVADTLVIAAFVFAMILILCFLICRRQKNPLPWINRIGYAFSGAYSIFVLELAIFSREAASRDGIFNNSMFSQKLTEVEKIYIFLNVLFFVPFAIAMAVGMYHQFKAVKSLLLTTGLTLLFSLFIETTQRLTGRGYFEVADLEANTLGGFIGALLGIAIGAIAYKCTSKKWRHKKKH